MATVTQKQDRHGRRVVLDDHLPVDRRLPRVHRRGAGLMGAFLVLFGVLGLIDRIGFFSTSGSMVMGLGSNGALSVASVLVGGLLLAGAVTGGNTASTVNMIVGVAFLSAGFASLAVLGSRFKRVRVPSPERGLQLRDRPAADDVRHVRAGQRIAAPQQPVLAVPPPPRLRVPGGMPCPYSCGTLAGLPVEGGFGVADGVGGVHEADVAEGLRAVPEGLAAGGVSTTVRSRAPALPAPRPAT